MGNQKQNATVDEFKNFHSKEVDNGSQVLDMPRLIVVKPKVDPHYCVLVCDLIDTQIQRRCKTKVRSLQAPNFHD